jgi:hypothetical protein
VNNPPIKTFSKRQNIAKASIYGTPMVIMMPTRDFIVGMKIKLKMFGVPITGTANMYCDNKGVP